MILFVTRFVFAIFAFLALASGIRAQRAVNPEAGAILARTIYHQDGTHTESVKDPATRELTEILYNANDVMISRRVYLLNERGQVTQGNIYDGQGNLHARAQVFFDEFGRVKEERLVNLNGEVFQQTVHEYGPDGKAKPPKVINFNVKAPMMKPQVVDFTSMTPPPGGGQPQPPSASNPNIVPVSPTPGTEVPANPEDGKPRKSFWKRLFDGKEKKSE